MMKALKIIFRKYDDFNYRTAMLKMAILKHKLTMPDEDKEFRYLPIYTKEMHN
jgi:hypothetical protein